MKSLILLSYLFYLLSCSSNNQIKKPEFQDIIDSLNVKGSVLIYDIEKDAYFSNDFAWSNMGHLPASTFKIPNSIIALESGVVTNDSTLIIWDGEKRWNENWNQDLIFKDAFHLSCVPCYQQVARTVGVEKMKSLLAKFNYGIMEVDSSTIDIFWLEGESKITQFQQIDFLKRFYLSKLPISERTETIMKKIMVIDENPNYKISGKTGWSIRNGNNNGWFVGYLEVKKNVYFFSTNVEPNEQFNMKVFPQIRKEITFKSFQQLGILDKGV